MDAQRQLLWNSIIGCPHRTTFNTFFGCPTAPTTTIPLSFNTFFFIRSPPPCKNPVSARGHHSPPATPAGYCSAWPGWLICVLNAGLKRGIYDLQPWDPDQLGGLERTFVKRFKHNLTLPDCLTVPLATGLQHVPRRPSVYEPGTGHAQLSAFHGLHVAPRWVGKMDSTPRSSQPKLNTRNRCWESEVGWRNINHITNRLPTGLWNNMCSANINSIWLKAWNVLLWHPLLNMLIILMNRTVSHLSMFIANRGTNVEISTETSKDPTKNKMLITIILPKCTIQNLIDSLLLHYFRVVISLHQPYFSNSNRFLPPEKALSPIYYPRIAERLQNCLYVKIQSLTVVRRT